MTGYVTNHQIKVASAAFFCAYLTTPLSPVVVVSWCHFYATILVGRDYQKLTITYAVYTLHRPTIASREQEANEVGQVTQNEQGTSHRPPYQ